MKALMLIFSIFMVSCSNKTNDINAISYFSYEQYDTVNNIYAPYSGLIMSESNKAFVIEQLSCKSIIYRIEKKTVDGNGNIKYELISYDPLEIHPCFPNAASLELVLIDQDAEKTYYEGNFSAERYRFFIMN